MNGVDLSEEEFSQLVEEKPTLVFIRGRWIKIGPSLYPSNSRSYEKSGCRKDCLFVMSLSRSFLRLIDVESDELDNPKAFAKIQIELNRNWKQMVKGLRDLKELPLEDRTGHLTR